MVTNHPVATPIQHEHERLALELTKHPSVKAAFDRVGPSWLEQAAPGPDMQRTFEAAFEEVMYAAAIWSLNQDSLRPKVIAITRLEHRLDGLRIPGSRWGIDNPDSVYRVIPISGDERYRISGRVGEARLSENYFTLWDESFNTIDVLNGSELSLDADRRFSITVDSEPAGDRPNHIRSAPAAKEFYIRDVVQDWSVETPNELEIERLGGAPSRPALEPDEQAELTAAFMQRYAESTFRWNQQAYDKPANELQFQIDRETDGALRNQIYILGHFDLEEDQALVVDVNTGGAGYFVAPITNCWGTTNDVVQRTGSLNLSQSLPNADGSYTFVLAKHDPGVHNWLDPCDMREGILTLRWAEFQEGRPTPEVGATSRIVSTSKLRDALPEETTFVTADERARQCETRAAGYKRRLPES
ncbi:MAG: hypothetical protein JRG84_17405 [Deltaproteobacteria bacterium]|nr:hypothetical protein [Deltaproteobacteria bacterium]